MSTVQDFYYLRVPETLADAPGGAQFPLASSNVLKAAKLPVRAAGCYTHEEHFSRAETAFSDLSQGHALAKWCQGNSKNSPLKEKEVIEITNNCLSLWKSFSASLFMKIVTQIISIADSYLQHLQLVKKSLNTPTFLKEAVPAAKLYTSLQSAKQAVQIINTAKDAQEANRGYGYTTLLSNTASALHSCAKLVAIYGLHKISPLTDIILSSAAFIDPIFEYLKGDETSEEKTIDELARERPVVITV